PDPEAHALRARAARVYGVPADHIMAGNGSDELLALVLRATIDPGDRVAFPVPTYSLYETLVAVQGGAAVRVPFPDDFSLPPALAAARARVTFLCNPTSPPGTAVPLPPAEARARASPQSSSARASACRRRRRTSCWRGDREWTWARSPARWRRATSSSATSRCRGSRTRSASR